MTYAELLAQIQSITENDEEDFVADIPDMVKRAEERILRKAQLPNFRKNSEGNLALGNRYLSTPDDYLSAYSLALVVSGVYTYLDFKDTSFMQEAFPDSSNRDVPRVYGVFDDDTLLVAPVPDVAYLVELHYFYKPESIVTASTSWLGDNAETALVYGSLVEGSIHMQSEEEDKAAYAAAFADAMNDLKTLAEGYTRTDSYRSGDIRMPRR